MHGGMVIAGRYQLDSEIGAGGMGVVWKATDLELRRVVAVKAGDGDQVRREARIGAGLQHPNVITVYDVVEENGTRWLVMEYLPSKSIAEILRTERPIAARRAAGIGAQIAAALGAMHDLGMTHRDITPGNVLVAEDGTAKLTDLGVATWGGVTRTGDEVIAGTNGFVAPEVAAGELAKPESDIYSLGATLSAAIEGLTPSENTRALRELLARMTHADPGRRPDAEQVGKLLGEIAGGAAKKRNLLIGLSAALVVASVAVTVVVVKSGGEQSAPAEVRSAFVGDPSTADVCALLDLEPLKKYGEISDIAESGVLNQCVGHVTLRDHGSLEVDLRVRLEEGPDSDSFETPHPPANAWAGPVTVRENLNGDQCRRIVYLPGDYRVVIVAWQNQHPPVLCDTADALVQGVLNAYDRGSLPRRPPHPPQSVATLNACNLLTTTEVADEFGTSQITSDNGLANWSCYWDSPRSDPSVQMTFEKSDPPSEREGTIVTLGGNKVIIDREGGGDRKCLASVNYRNYLDHDQEKGEYVEIVWRSRKPSDERCAAVTKLATIVAEKLP